MLLVLNTAQLALKVVLTIGKICGRFLISLSQT
jgi:hypothetical protein